MQRDIHIDTQGLIQDIDRLCVEFDPNTNMAWRLGSRPNRKAIIDIFTIAHAKMGELPSPVCVLDKDDALRAYENSLRDGEGGAFSPVRMPHNFGTRMLMLEPSRTTSSVHTVAFSPKGAVHMACRTISSQALHADVEFWRFSRMVAKLTDHITIETDASRKTVESEFWWRLKCAADVLKTGYHVCVHQVEEIRESLGMAAMAISGAEGTWKA